MEVASRIIEPAQIDFSERLTIDLSARHLMRDGVWLVPEVERPDRKSEPPREETAAFPANLSLIRPPKSARKK